MSGKNRNKHGRSSVSYNKKVNRIKAWYAHLQKERAAEPEKINPNNKLPVKRAELKSLDYYIDQLKKPSKGE